jgi:hypothetical protein
VNRGFEKHRFEPVNDGALCAQVPRLYKGVTFR